MTLYPEERPDLRPGRQGREVQRQAAGRSGQERLGLPGEPAAVTITASRILIFLSVELKDQLKINSGLMLC